MLLASLVLGAFLYQLCSDSAEAARKAVQAQQLLSELAFVRSSTLQIELETQTVRFAAQASPQRPQEYQIARREVSLSHIRSLVRDSAAQQARWLQLRQVIDERVAIVSEALRLRQDQGPAAAAAFLAKSPLMPTRQRMHALLDAMEGDALQQLRLMNERQTRARSQLRWSLVAAGSLMVTLLAAGGTLIRRQFQFTERLRLELSTRAEHLDIALKSVGDAVLMTDAEGRVRRMNPAAERLLKQSQQQAQGKSVEDLLCLLDSDVPASTARTSRPSPEDCRGSAELVHLRLTDGKVCEVRLSTAPLWGWNRSFQGSVYVVRATGDEPVPQALRNEQTDESGHAAAAAVVRPDSSAPAPASVGR